MKAIFKQRKIELLDGIKITEKDVGRILTDNKTLKQEIVKEDGKLILRSHEIDNSEAYKSTLDIDVYLNNGDILLKNDVGYTKPVMPVIELSKKLEKSINNINEVL